MTLLQSLRSLGRIAKLSRGMILLSTLLGGLYVCATLAFVWLTKGLVDAVTGRSAADVGDLVWLYVAVIIVKIVLFVAISYLNSINLVLLRQKLRARLFGRIMGSEWQGAQLLHSADMTNRLDEDVRVVADTLCNNLPNTIIAIVQFIAAFGFLLYLQPILAWVLLVVMPLSVIVSKLFITKMRSLTHSIRNSDSNIQAHIQESIENKTNIAAFAQSSYVERHLSDLQSDLVGHERRRIAISSYTRLALNMGFMAGYATAFLWGIFGLQSGAITFGLMTAFLQLVAQIQNPVVDLSHKLPAFIAALTSADRITEIEELPLQKQGDQIVLSGAVGVNIEGLTFRYEESGRYIFKDFTYRFRPAKITAITGETGVGKSTLIRLMLAIISPESGTISLCNDGGKYPISPLLRSNIQYVPQGNTLISGTLRDNLRLGNPAATDLEMERVLQIACCDFIGSLDDRYQERGCGLSEGQAQRIAIARALLSGGSLLLLDEPTSSLDEATERIFLQRLKEEAANKTIIIITHRALPIEAADEVLRIEKPMTI